eukprot:595238-Amphidinium_carterae.1
MAANPTVGKSVCLGSVAEVKGRTMCALCRDGLGSTKRSQERAACYTTAWHVSSALPKYILGLDVTVKEAGLIQCS